MKTLNGNEFVDYIKMQQAQIVRSLRGGNGPKQLPEQLEVVVDSAHEKLADQVKAYAQDLGLEIVTVVVGDVADPPEFTAANWLLAGYNVNLLGKRIVVLKDELPAADKMAQLWQGTGLDVTGTASTDANFAQVTKGADVAVGYMAPLSQIKEMKPDVVFVDLGSTEEPDQTVVAAILDDAIRSQ